MRPFWSIEHHHITTLQGRGDVQAEFVLLPFYHASVSGHMPKGVPYSNYADLSPLPISFPLVLPLSLGPLPLSQDLAQPPQHLYVILYAILYVIMHRGCVA